MYSVLARPTRLAMFVANVVNCTIVRATRVTTIVVRVVIENVFAMVGIGVCFCIAAFASVDCVIDMVVFGS